MKNLNKVPVGRILMKSLRKAVRGASERLRALPLPRSRRRGGFWDTSDVTEGEILN